MTSWAIACSQHLLNLFLTVKILSDFFQFVAKNLQLDKLYYTTLLFILEKNLSNVLSAETGMLILGGTQPPGLPRYDHAYIRALILYLILVL